jgi:hypothetical protein
MNAEKGEGMAEQFVVWARILRAILEYVRRASGKTTVREDAGLNLL